MKHLVALGVVVLVLVVAALLNPSKDRHKEAIIVQYKEDNPLTGTFGAGHLLAEIVSYKNRGLFSSTSIGEERISLGYLGHVQVRPLDLRDLPDAIMERLQREEQSLLRPRKDPGTSVKWGHHVSWRYTPVRGCLAEQ